MTESFDEMSVDEAARAYATDLSKAVACAMRAQGLDAHGVAGRARCTVEAVRALIEARDGQTWDSVSRIARAVGLRIAAKPDIEFERPDAGPFQPVGVFTHDDGLIAVCEDWSAAVRIALSYVRATHADDELEMAEDVWIDAIEPNSILL